MKQRKKGITIIVLSILLFAGFVSYEIFNKKEKEQIVEEQSAELPSVSSSAVSMVPLTPSPPPDAETEEDKNSSLVVDINENILNQLQVTRKEFITQIQIFKNSFGYGGKSKLKDMGEITINYREKTITIPCYMTVSNKVIKFDVIYQMNKKTWRFVPW